MHEFVSGQPVNARYRQQWQRLGLRISTLSPIGNPGSSEILKSVSLPEVENELKAQMIVHNLTDYEDISLKTADGKVKVLGPIAADTFSVIEINPIKVSFAIFKGDEKYIDLTDWPLERGESYIISVAEDDEYGTVANYDRARISTE